MPDHPPRVYKYLTPELANRILQALQIRFSQVSSLNDATEFDPPLLGIGEKATVVDALKERFEKKYPGLLASYLNLLPASEVDKIVQESMEGGAETVEADLEKTKVEIYKRLDDNFGVLSLSESPYSKLLWAHYADGDRGYLLEFDANHPWFWQKKQEDDGFRHLRKVRYTESRDAKYLMELNDDDVLYTKDREWEYEMEWRIIQSFNAASVKTGTIDRYGKDVLLFAIPPECLTGVIAGFRADAQFTDGLRQIVNSNPLLSHVGFRRIQRHQNVLTLADDEKQE
jgi:hypothetical protein